MKTIAITGATGLLGSHIIFETIKQYHLSGLPYQIVVLGRSKGETSLEQRIENMLHCHLPDYLFGESAGSGIELVNSRPQNMTDVEKLYYEHIGTLFGPYITRVHYISTPIPW